MPQFYDLCVRNRSEELEAKMQELGWNTSPDLETVFLEAEEWGELKRKIGEERNEADVLVFKGGNEKLNRKACEDSRIDVLLHPEKGRKDSGFNHVTAKEASKNQVAIGLDITLITEASNKVQSHLLRHWKRNLMLCENYNSPYIITTSARNKYELRAPKDLESIIESLGYNGKKAVSEFPEQIKRR
ncbi:MAG: hypothetical protein BRC27_00720 [Nanohaloarchaea archaeon SW_10_44_10]|nr:MAG: hypothetical protein BRC27_00720 [Nanohaloarchaea archaeon SW_10_44_10]